MAAGDYIVFGDLQIPFEAEYAFEWAKQLISHYKIPRENICLAGDEVDEYFASAYAKNPNALHTPASELRESIDRLRRWSDAFPIMRIPVSNHGIRWFKRANDAGIPSHILKTYAQILETPPGWRWKNRWLIKDGLKQPFILTHGMEYGGKNVIMAALDYETHNVVFGHHHSKAGVLYQQNIEHEDAPRPRRWASCTGSLINKPAYAFEYGTFNKLQPINGCTYIYDEGRQAQWIAYPYEK